MKCSAVSLAALGINLDRYFIDERNDFYAVMDGTTAGGEFSDLFVTWLAEMVENLRNRLEDSPQSTEKISESFAQFIEEANQSIHERMAEYYGGRHFSQALGAGSTLVLAQKVDEQWVIANSGDSQALLVRESKVYPLTTTDSEFNQWIEDGLVEVRDGKVQFEQQDDLIKYAKISSSKAEVIRAMRRMVRWVGNGATPHCWIEPAHPEDKLILWTDGAEHIARWHARNGPSWDSWDEEKVIQAVSSVIQGKAKHFFAALPSFWSNYLDEKRLWDDATALVIYEG